ncbi:YdcF family protein [Chitinilyticum litopenaei]|uniref:YdcF family protein n=2 Tax=Chitinilyticum piscinae TaxID=2866724 RepID=A0A8J7G319_9NEIS|nr:YdcF family protein [Chitinilyticum piscinae]
MARFCRWSVVLLAALLLLDAAVLMAMGQLNVGTIGPLFLGAGLLWLVLGVEARRQWLAAAPWRRCCWRLLVGAAAVWLVSLLYFFMLLAWQPRPSLSQPPSALIVLGSGLQGTKPGPMLRLRLESAQELAAKFPQAKLLVSGGQGWSEEISEAEAMRRWLRAHGVDATRIVPEAASSSTEENLLFSRQALLQVGIDVARDPVLIITSDFHTVRSKGLASAQGYRHFALAGAPTPWHIRGNAWFREYFATASSWLLGEY